MSREPLDTLTAARLLHEAAATGTPIEPLRDRVAHADLAGAYAVQAENTALALQAGRRLVGRKIGLTSPAVQAQLAGC